MDKEVSLRQLLWLRVELTSGDQPREASPEEHEIEKSGYQKMNFMETAAVGLFTPTIVFRSPLY